MNLKKILLFILLITTVFTINKIHSMYNKIEIVESKVDKSIFKNKLIDEIKKDFVYSFSKENYNISKFHNENIDSNIFFFSKIEEFNNSILIIEYSDFTIKKLSLKFENIEKENIDLIAKMMAILIEVSDENISKADSYKIIINMMNEFEKSKQEVTLLYTNNIIYSLNIVNNNSLEFIVK